MLSKNGEGKGKQEGTGVKAGQKVALWCTSIEVADGACRKEEMQKRGGGGEAS